MADDKNAGLPRVLIADDMVINRTILSSLLASYGIPCDLAQDGLECIKLYKENRYDLILLDHRMPKLDGVDTLVQLKEIFRKQGREIPVICHTTDAGRENINLYKAAGFSDVLIKPVESDEMARLLEKYLPDSSIKRPVEDDSAKLIEYELKKLPAWLKAVPKLDLRVGVENCESAEDYLDALSIFAASITDKSNDIEKFAKDANWSMYIVRVHSLKSMARLVGATQLAEQAADLEYAGKQGRFEKLEAGTEQLLIRYRRFREFLSGLSTKYAEKDRAESVGSTRGKGLHRILFVSDGKGLVCKGIVSHLEAAGFAVTQAMDDEIGILEHRNDGDIVVYNPTGTNGHIHNMSNYLSEICRDDRKIYFLAGNPNDVEEARRIPLSNWIRASYERPIDLDSFAAQMLEYSEILHEYRRTKSLLIIDDDMDFLSVIERLLRDDYKVDCVRSGKDAMFFMESRSPDLILLDYEMPEMDGYEVLREIRKSPRLSRIPVVFLTGKNERENVMRVMERKPDGYLLKSMPKAELLNYLERFFSKSILWTIRGSGT